MPLTPIQLSPTVNATSGTLTATLPQATGTGNSLVACITANGDTTTPTVSGLTLGGSADNWKAAYTDPTTSHISGAFWYDPGCASGQTSVVLTVNAGSGTNLCYYLTVYEVPGILVFDQGSHGDSTSSPAATWSSGATATTAQANEIYFGVTTATLEVPVVTGAGTWTTQSSGGGTLDQANGYQVVSSTGTATFSGTFTASGRGYAALAATFYQQTAVSVTAKLAGTGSATAVLPAVAAFPAGTGSARSQAVVGVTASLAGAGAAQVPPRIAVTASLAGAGSLTGTAAGPLKVTASLAGTGSATAGIGLTEDGSTPPTAQTAGGSAATSVTTATFTPPSNSLLVAMGVVNYAANPVSPPVLSVNDSFGGTWTAATQLVNGPALTVSNIFTCPVAVSPGPVTVTLSRGSDSTAAMTELAVRVLIGANLNQAGAAQAAAAGSSTAFADTVTTRVRGSLVYACGTGSGTGQSAAVLAGTTQIDNRADTTDTGLLLFARSTGPTVTPGTGSPGAVGFTLGTSDPWAVTGLEILPATGDSGAASLAGAGSARSQAVIGVTASLAGGSSAVINPPEASPALELSGFGTFSGVPGGSTINSVIVTVTEHQSASGEQACTFELWDYSGAPAKIGATQTGTQSTSTSNASAATFTGVTQAMLPTLRVRVFGNGEPGTGVTESVDAVSLTVNYTPPGTASVTAILAGTGQATVPGPSHPGSILDEALAAILDEAGTAILDEGAGLSGAAIGGIGTIRSGVTIGVTANAGTGLAGAGSASAVATVAVTATAAGAGSAASGAIVSVTAALAGSGSASSGAAIRAAAALAGTGSAASGAVIAVTASLAGAGSARAPVTVTALVITGHLAGAGSIGAVPTIRVRAVLAGSGGASASLARPPLFLTAALKGAGRAFEQFYSIDISVTAGIAKGVLSAGIAQGDGWAVRATRGDLWTAAASKGDGLAASGASSDGGTAAATKNDGITAGASKGDGLSAAPSVGQRSN